jgi:hypothetical protein
LPRPRLPTRGDCNWISQRAVCVQWDDWILRALWSESFAANSLAHDLQHAGEDGNMATKMKLLKLLQEVKGFAQITNRRPAPRPPFLYLMQLRSQTAQVDLPKRRLAIEKGKDTSHVPLPVKINHIRPDDPGLPVIIR